MVRHVSQVHVVRRSAANVLKNALINYSLAVVGWSSEGTLVLFCDLTPIFLPWYTQIMFSWFKFRDSNWTMK